MFQAMLTIVSLHSRITTCITDKSKIVFTCNVCKFKIYVTSSASGNSFNYNVFLFYSNLFSSLRNLRELDLKENRLRHIDSQAFIAFKKLGILDMSNNLLQFTDTSMRRTMSPLKFCDMLEDLQLANNSLTKIFIDWREFKELHILNLAHNAISHIKVCYCLVSSSKFFITLWYFCFFSIFYH